MSNLKVAIDMNYSGFAELALIKAAQNGDKTAMNQLLQIYYDYIYGVAYRTLGRKEDAEDVCQNALINITTGIKSYDINRKFSTWIYTITLNAAREKYRKSKRYFEVLGSYGEEKKVQKQAKNNQEDISEFVLYHLNRLPEKLREALVLTTYEQKTHAEAAEILGCAENTVSWRVHEARKILKETLGKELQS